MLFNNDASYTQIAIGKENKNRGLRALSAFTLIELLITITIIAMLIAAASVSWKSAQLKQRDNKRKTDLKAIQQALQSYYQAFGFYPPPTGGHSWDGWCSTISNPSSELSATLVPKYIYGLPKDPTAINAGDPGDYAYSVGTGGQSYFLYAKLESPNDPDNAGAIYDLSGCLTHSPAPGAGYNYRLLNP